ncbi:E3 ubiquitin-protein ligase TRIP12 [Amphibalanus amphitrite]|uniref:E3 ubiquitin-protein ligase n=1 Tax=Amphibalanus amphitrite TaxID=1232801 RepID=A0A6A4X1F7_AMPAM|nr:E3 ubiquitin-protein ligase TRIP12 [Amphibalanus amphitrite]
MERQGPACQQCCCACCCRGCSRRGSRGGSDKPDWPSTGSSSSSRNSSGSTGDEPQGELVHLRELLQARGVPQHLLEQLAPPASPSRHRGHAEGGCRMYQLLQMLQCSEDESLQLQAVVELGQLLVMASEDTLGAFPAGKFVPPITRLIQADRGDDLVTQACRTLTHLLELVPHSSAAAVAALPALLQQLRAISSMEVAEQALAALELLTKRHGNAVLQAGGITSCLAFFDFFSAEAQRAALSVTAGCCLSLTSSEFHLISPHLSAIASRLCHQLAGSPPVIGSSTFCEVTRMLRLLCAHCPPIAVQLLTESIAGTLKKLLTTDTGQPVSPGSFRNSEEVYSLVCLVSELLPPLPSAALFDVDQLLTRRVSVRRSGSYDRVESDRSAAPGGSRGVRPAADPRAAVLRPADWLPLLLDVYGAAPGTAVRHVCLRATLRCVSAAEPETLKGVLNMQELSVQLASLLPSPDVKLAVPALQLAETLMQKLPDLCTSHFRREGGVARALAAGGRSRSVGGAGAPGRLQTSLLASLSPARWGRASSSSPHGSHRNSLTEAGAAREERARSWLRRQARLFLERHLATAAGGHCAALALLESALRQLAAAPDRGLADPLRQLAALLLAADLSPFELLQAGLVPRLTELLTAGPAGARRHRLRAFLHALAGAPAADRPQQAWVPSAEKAAPLAALVTKLNACVAQQEQLPVKSYDVTDGVSGHGALRYFTEHQLKVELRRAPDGGALRQWRHGPVKVDPLAPLQAIERYLVIRGYGRSSSRTGRWSDDSGSDEDVEDALVAASLSHSGTHRLQFLMGGRPLPYDITVFQAVEQYGPRSQDDDGDVSASQLFQKTHTIYYRQAPISSSSGGNSSSSRRQETRPASGGESLWATGSAPVPDCPLVTGLKPQLPESVTVADPSLATVNLLRLLHCLSRHYGGLYQLVASPPLLGDQVFVNAQLTAKAERQLFDPLILMAGSTPPWILQLGLTCGRCSVSPFLFPFAVRRQLFFSATFERDRALSRLLEVVPSAAGSGSERRLAPRLERRRRTVSRRQPARQAETLLSELAGSPALLELQYRDEPGSGLGPTLEFYAQVCSDVQRVELGLWRRDQRTAHTAESSGRSEGAPVPAPATAAGPAGPEYVFAPHGLYPAPIGRTEKNTSVTRLRTKFTFLGRLMAKALADGRLLDMSLSVPFYHWLLRRERTMSLTDLHQLDGTLATSVARLANAARRRRALETDAALSDEQRRAALAALTVDGCAVEQLGLDFTLPGYPDIELRRGGRAEPVTAANLEQYVKLLTHWILIEGVHKQMEAFREGFESVAPLDNLAMFQPEELDQLFCGTQDALWDRQSLAEAFRPDHGYTADSAPFRHLVTVLSELDPRQRRQFLSFATGSPRLPVGGFRALTPPLTVVRKAVEPGHCPDTYLPSVMTCVNYLKLPEYSSVEVTRRQLTLAISEGQLSFMLS